MVGADRAFGYDAAITMHRFVAVPFPRVLGDQVTWNNHPLFSLVEHAVWRATGSADETVMRVAPSVFGALAVGLLIWRLTARFGVPAGILGGAVVAVGPLAADARDVRGYSLALLAVVVMAIAVLELDSPHLFGVAWFVGLGTHLHVVPAAAVLVAYVVAARRFDRCWRVATAAGFLAAVTLYLGMVDGIGRGGRVWRPAFLADAGWYVLGGSSLAVAAGGLMVVLAARSATWSRPQLAMSAMAALGVLGSWAVAPTDLYPRFVFWLLPAVALAVAAAVAARPRSVVVAVIGIAAALVPQLERWTRGSSNRDLAAAAGGVQACLLGYSAEAVRWYCRRLPRVSRATSGPSTSRASTVRRPKQPFTDGRSSAGRSPMRSCERLTQASALPA